MEHLTKAQIVLLTLFVGFVSSMATGIVVVTLMQQAPEPILQTITKVVEKTIEKVVPTIIEKPGKQIVIKDEDLLIAAIDRNIQGVVAFKISDEDGEVRSAGVGVIISPDGMVVTNKKNVGGGVMITTVGGVRYALELVPGVASDSFALGKLVSVVPAATSSPVVVFAPVVLADRSVLKVGQTAVVIGGWDGRTIANGLVTSLDERMIVNKDTKVETKIIEGIGLSQRLSNFSNGAPIISLEGVVIGLVSINENTESQVGIPVAQIRELVSAMSVSSATVKTEPAGSNLSAGVQTAL
jgi:hypothetical protein